MRTLRPRKIFEYIMLSYPSLTHTFVNENCNIWGGAGSAWGRGKSTVGLFLGLSRQTPGGGRGAGRGGAVPL